MTKIKQNIDIILASSSPIRKKILTESGIDFQIIKPECDEEKLKEENLNLEIADLALFLAQEKALSISKLYPEKLVIGSDQICQLNDKKFDKSKSQSEAIAQLKAMSGKTHIQNNGLIIAKNSQIILSKINKVQLTMRNLTDSDIKSYVEIDNPINCAGSYKFESFGKHLFAKIKGDYYSILGLNIQDILNFLHEEKYLTF